MIGQPPGYSIDLIAATPTIAHGDDDDEPRCILCGRTDGLTVEHIIPQTLLIAWGLPTGAEETASLRTWLCHGSNATNSAIHAREDVQRLLRTGQASRPATFNQFADWAIWVTILLGVSQEASIWPRDDALALLRNRFPCSPNARPRASSAPKGTRVYAVLSDGAAISEVHDSYAVQLRHDERVLLDPNDDPIGLTSIAGLPLHAATALQIDAVVVLVVGPTWRSGPDHEAVMDEAAAQAGLTRIHPPNAAPSLGPQSITTGAIAEIFTTDPFSVDVRTELVPAALRHAIRGMVGHSG
jgi:hypothetical protein